MTEPEVSRLRNQLQAGIMLVDFMLTAHRRALVGVDSSLIEDLRRWIAGASRFVPPMARSSDGLQCGHLRRDPDGSWWWGSRFLGTDGNPEESVNPGDDVGLVVEALSDGLDAAANHLAAAGDDAGLRAARRVLLRYRNWQSTGAW